MKEQTGRRKRARSREQRRKLDLEERQFNVEDRKRDRIIKIYITIFYILSIAIAHELRVTM